MCEELGETKWTDADSDDMASMSPQGLIHGTACGSGEGTPKKLSEPAISRRANVANQEEWFGQIPIPLAAGVRMHFKKLPPRDLLVFKHPQSRGHTKQEISGVPDHMGAIGASFCHWLQIDTDCEFDMCLGFIGRGNRAVRLAIFAPFPSWLPLAFVKTDTAMDGWQNRCEACDLCPTN